MNICIATLGNLFSTDTLIIFLVILILFGSKKLPELARSLGQAVREFGRAKDEIERELTRPPEVTIQPAQGRLEHKPVEVPAAPVASVPSVASTTPAVEPTVHTTHPAQS